MKLPGGTRSTRRAAAAIPALAVLALTTSACGIGGGNDAQLSKDATDPIVLGGGSSTSTTEATETSSGSGSDGGSTSGVGGAVTAPIQLDRTVWAYGFKLELERASVETAEDYGNREFRRLKISGVAENLGGDTKLYEDARLEQQGVSIASGTMETQSTVLAGSRNALGILFNELPDSFDPATTQLVIGDAKHQQVRVPLRGDSGAVTGEPKTLKPFDSVRAGTLVLTAKSVTMRADDPSNHKQAPSDTAYVVIEGSVRFDKHSSNVQNQNVSLIPPNGAPQSPLYVNALPRSGSSEDVYLVFPMPAPLGGTYKLELKGDYGLDADGTTGNATGEVTFTLDPYAAGGASAAAATRAEPTGS